MSCWRIHFAVNFTVSQLAHRGLLNASQTSDNASDIKGMAFQESI